MAGVLLRDQFLCEFDGEGYYLSEIDAHRVNLPDAGEGVEVRIIPDGRMNNIQYGDSFIRLSMNDARLLAQAILSVAFEGVHRPPFYDDQPDLLGPEPPVGRLPTDPRAVGNAIHYRAADGTEHFIPLGTDTLPRVDKPTIGGDKC